jgi:hypothetical protein
VELARDPGFARKNQADAIITTAAEISRMLHGLVVKVREDE